MGKTENQLAGVSPIISKDQNTKKIKKLPRKDLHVQILSLLDF